MNRKLGSKFFGVLTGAAALSLVLVFSPSAATSATSVKMGGSLTVAQPWGTIPDNFNPFLPASSQAHGNLSCIYQSLYYINGATGVQTPLLATNYAWASNDLKLIVTTRSGVTWSDGKPFSAADVAFTFNYMKANPTLDINGVWTSPLVSVKEASTNTVVFTFSKPDTPAAVAILFGTDGNTTVIVPKHIWASITKPATYANTSPVGTGPFVLTSFSPSSIVYSKNPSYSVTAKPYINSVVFSSTDSNTTAELGLENGTIDMSYDAISDVSKTFVAKDPSANGYFWPQTNMNYLYFNTAKPPFNDVSFRKAVALDLNPTFLTDRAYFGSLSAATGGAEADVIPAQVAEWVPSSLASLEWTHSVTQAKAVLKAAGYKWSSSGKLESPSGVVYPSFTVLSGGPGWTDYISLIDNISFELKQIGISATPIQEPFSTYYSDLQKGSYDFGLCWGNGNGPTPYYQYYYMFSAGFSAPIGKVATTDFERFTSPLITSALASYASSSSPVVQKADMAAIEKVVLTEVPVLALTGRGNWLVYQTRMFTGFPSTTNPYNDGSASDQEGAMFVYLNVHLK